MTNPLPFGPATIEIGEGADALKLGGVNYFQVDGGEFNAEPKLEDIKFQDYGDSPYDQRVSGYEGTLKVVAPTGT